MDMKWNLTEVVSRLKAAHKVLYFTPLLQIVSAVDGARNGHFGARHLDNYRISVHIHQNAKLSLKTMFD